MLLEYSSTNREILREVTTLLGSKGGVIVSYEMEENIDKGGSKIYVVNLVLKTQKINEQGVLKLLNDFPDITIYKIV